MSVRAVTLAVACLLAGTALAAPPNGTYSAEIGGGNEIYLPVATWGQQIAGGGLVGDMNFSTEVDAVGRITGAGTIDVNGLGGIATGSGPMLVTGKLAGPVRRAAIKMDVAMK